MADVERLAGMIRAAMDTRDDYEGIAEVLLANGLFLPPEGATMSEGRLVEVDGLLSPWAGSELTFDGDGQVYGVGYGRITDQYETWLEAQPGRMTRTYEWPDGVVADG